MKTVSEIYDAIDLLGNYLAHPGKTIDQDTVNVLTGCILLGTSIQAVATWRQR